MKLFLIIIPLFLCLSCERNNKDFVREGQALCAMMAKDLESVQTRHDVLKAQELFQKHYRRFAKLTNEARSSDSPNIEEGVVYEQSQRLQRELARVYAIEGVREALEACQKQALYDLYLMEEHAPKRE